MPKFLRFQDLNRNHTTARKLSARIIQILMILSVLFGNFGINPVSAASYTISGNAGVAGATITFSGTGGGTTTSDSSGNYSMSINVTLWYSGTATPSKTGYTFSPSTRTYNFMTSSQTNQNYTATAVTYTISGSTGSAGGGATITYTGGSTTANASTGNYSFTVTSGWSGTVTPTKTGYTFSPVSRTYTTVTANQTNQNYTAALSGYTISGNAGVGSATITYTGGSTTASGSGAYTFFVAPGWSGTVTPSKTGFSFAPTSLSFTNVSADQPLQNFTARPTVFTFGSMGDSSAEATYFASTVNQLATLNPALVLFNGDLENAGFATSEINPMIADLKSANLFNNTFLVRGNADNHVDGSAALWESYFETAPNIKTPPAYVANHVALDSNSDNLVYSFDYGNSIFIGLDVPGDVGGAGGSQNLTDAQLTFLNNRLTYAEAAGLTHAFIFFHGPEYPVTSIHSTCATRAEANCTPPALMTIINNHPIVSATFHGHEQILGWTHMDGTRDSVLTRSYEEFFSSPAGGSTYNDYVYPDRVDYVYPDMTSSDFGFATISVNGLSFTYSIYKVGTTTPVWSHTFSKVNTPPTISDITDKTTNEDTATGAIPFTVGDAETSLNYLTVTATSSNPTLVPDGNISLGGSGANRTINILPGANQSGTATITVSVNDGNVTVNDTFLLTVNPVNDPPVADAQSISMSWNTSINIVLTGSDVEGNSLTYSIVNNPGHGSLSGSGANQTYTPTANYSGTDSFTFKVNDGTSDSAPATVNIAVAAYTISGNAGVAGATLSYTDGTPKTITADGTGLYSFQVPAGWSGIVTPAKAGFTFSPASMTYVNVLADQPGQNYSTTGVLITISGYAGVAGAMLSYTDGTAKTATADSSGNYSFTVSYNWSGTVTPSLTGYGFLPSTRTYNNVTTDQASQNYTTTTARVWYVDNTNAACTDTGQVASQAVPFCTINRGANFVNAGQILHVLHGTYAETIYGNYSGTAGSPITYLADPGVTVTGQSSTTTAYSAFALSAKSYIVIDGFNITNTGGQGIYIYGSNHITIQNNHVSYAGTTFASHPYTQGIWMRQTTYSTITGNTVDHNTCIGIRVVEGGYNLISNNRSFENFSVVETDAAGIEMTGSSNNTIINNIVYSNEDSGINLYYFDTTSLGSTNNLVIGNLSYENGDHGIDNYQSPNNTIVGNTIQGNGTTGINFEGNTGKGSFGAIVENNIISANGLTPPSGSWGGNLRFDSNSITGATTDYNLFNRDPRATVQIVWNNLNYTSLAAFRTAVPTQEVNGLEGNPLFVNPVAPVLRQTGVPYVGLGIFGNYYPSAGSPEIDSANSNAPSEQLYDIDGNNRIDDPATPNTGTGVRTYDDRGAYEYLPAGPSLPIVTTQMATNILTTTATGNGTVTATGLPNPTQHGVVWGLSLNPTLLDSKTVDGPVSAPGAFTSAITGLTPGTLYHVRAYATNDVGTVYGNDVIFTAALAPIVTTQAVTAITATTATGNGNITSLGVPNPTQHGVVWSLSANPTTADSKTTDGAVSAIGAFTSSITGLTPGTLYHVRAYATNDAATVYGDDVTFTSLIVPTVTTQAVTNILTTIATGNGNVTSLGIPNPTQHGFVWALTANPTTANSLTTDGPVSATGAFVSNLTGLNPNTLYHVRAYATNAAGTVYGEDVTFTTLLAPSVTTQAVTNIATTTATGNGNITAMGTANPTEHGVVWSTALNPTILDSKTTDGPVSATGPFTSAITGLTPGTLYHVRAYATSIAGTAYGSDVTFTSLIAPTVTTQAVTNITQTTAMGNGTITSLGVPNPTQYGVVWDIAINPTVALTTKTAQGAATVTGAFTSNITGLNLGQTYHVRAYATNAVGTAYGDDVSFTTLASSSTTTTPVTNARTGADVSGVGTGIWLNPGNITAADSTYAQVTINSATSHYLQGSNYGFAIPANATINGIAVTIGRYEGGTSGVRDSVVSLLKAGVVTGSNKAASSTDWPTSNAAATYGSNSDLWGATWTPADINANTFGVALSATSTANRIAYVDYMQIAVTYTVSVVSSTTSVNCGAGTPTVTYGSSITCLATVTAGSGSFTPSGNVTWTTNGSGSFVTSPCSISGNNGTAACSVTYTPSTVGTGSHLITATYAGDGSFYSSNNNQTVTINKKVASVTVTAASKTYGDADPTLTGTLTGFVPADGVTAAYSRVAGEAVAGSPYTISAVLSPAGILANYTITYNTANFTINPKAASVTPTAASKTYGDVDPASFIGTLTGFLPADNVTATYSRIAGNNAGTYSISATLSPAGVLGNYAITYNTANFTINPKAASVLVNDASKTYGAADPTLTGTLTGFLPADNVTATFSRVAGETVAGSPYVISATLSPVGVLSNYTITNTPASFTINKKAASVTPNVASKTYGAADPTLDGSLVGFLPADNVTAAYSRAAGETVAGSPYTISATLSPAGVLDNYNITNTPANFTINKRAATVTVSSASKAYGATDPILTGTVTGFMPADNVTAAYSRAAGETVADGPYAITATLSPTGVLANYDITNTPASFTIHKIDASVIVNAASKTYGAADPTLTGTLVGFVPADNVTAVYSRAAGETVAGGPYTISAVLSPAGVLANYNITNTPASFIINKKNASVTPAAHGKIYGDADPTLTGSLVGFVPADEVTASYHRAVGETVAGSPYTISATLSPAGVLANYDVTYDTASFNITKKDASVTPNAASKTYGAADPALTGSLVGFVPADSVTAAYSRAAGETVAGGPYTISAVLSPAGLSANYNITYNTANFTINAKAASVTPAAASKPLGQPDPALTGTLAGFLPADGVSAVYSRTAGETVEGSPYTISAVLSPAGVLPNYNVTYNTANFTITAPLDEYTLTINKTGNGTVAKSPDKATYHYGDVVTLTATADPGWTFFNWSANVVGGTITIHSNTTVTAMFTQDAYTLTVNSAHGTVTKAPNQSTYHYGDVVTLMATPDVGWSFGSWSTNATGGTVTINGNTTVTANFTQDEYSLTINKIGNGTVTKAPDQTTYHYGDSVQLAATPAAGWSFGSWDQDAPGGVVTIHGNTIVWVTFTQDEYTLTIDKTGNGTVTKAPDQATYHYGDVVALTATPDAGWSFGSWSANATGGTVTIHGNTTASATFTQDEYTLTINTTGNGSVGKSPVKDTYHYGDVVALTPTPDVGWHFDTWSANATGGSVTIHGNTTVSAAFVLDEYTLTINKTGNGSVAQTPSQATYHYNDVVTLTATPDAGWSFGSWSANVVAGNVTIHSNTTVTATFTQDAYTLTIDKLGNGTVTAAPVKTTYHYGDVVTLTATPDVGWSFGSWSANVVAGSVTIQGNLTVTATFTQDEYSLTINKTGNGTVTEAPAQATYHYGDVVALTATPDAGWSFGSWSANVVAGNVTIHSNTTVTATFTQDEYTLTIDKVGSGAVTKVPDQATYHYGDVVALTATADQGWGFVGWSTNVVAGNVTLHNNTTVTATFGALSTPVVTTQAVSAIGTDTATGNGTIVNVGAPAASEHGVVWSTSPNPDISLPTKTTDGPVSGTGAFTSSITGLTPGTLYHVRAYATNTQGTIYGAEVSFTTLKVPTITTLAVSGITTTTATGNGNISDLGVPNPTQHGVAWGTSLNPTIGNSKTTDGPVSATGDFTSSITGLTPGTQYHVRAYAINAVDVVYGDDVIFTTLNEPAVTTQAVTAITTTTATGNGNVTALGVPNPTEHGVVWGTALNPTTADSKTTDGTVSATGAFTSSITGLTPGTLYHVRAYATNAAGTAYGDDVTFTALIAPTVTTQAVTAITTTTATGNGNVTALGVPNPTEHGVVWGTALNPTTADSKTTDGAVSAAGAFTSSITGLAPNTLYHLRAYATNSAGTAYGDDVTFTTSPLAPTVTTQAVTAITAATATGNGNVTNLGVPNPTQHGVVWGTALNPTLADSKTTDGAVSAVGAFTSNITGLAPNTLYHVRAYATNTAGTAYGSDVTFTSSPLAATITTQAATDITGATATGNGNITSLGIPGATQYGVVWDTAINPTIALSTKTQLGVPAGTGAFTSSITGLTANTLYHVRAYATNTAGTAYGNDVTFTTQTTPTVTTQAVSAITTTTATGNGNVTNLGVPNPTQHGVVWSLSLNPTTADSKTADGVVNATGAFTSSITGLTPGTLYHVRAYATNAVGTSYGSDVTFTTSSTAPTVTTQAVTTIRATSATGNGNVTALGGPNPTQHGVVWALTANPTTANSLTTDGAVSATGAFTSNITGLTPNTLYHVRAYATNTAGTSYGSDVSFTTSTATQQTFTSSGTWTAPAGVTSVTVEVWGGGGRGGDRSSTSNTGSGGGGGGAYSSSTITVTPGNNYSYSVGAGSTTSGTAGGDSYFINNTTLMAKGGGSVAANTTTGATGGASASGYGTTKYSGGNGASAASGYGGGGGSSAGTAANGTNATNATGATAPSGGANGGNGSTGAGNGTTGSAPGGAGGGAYRTFSSSYTGGNGANGQVRLTYTVSTTGTTTSINCGAGNPSLTYGTTINCVATVTAASGTTSPTGTVAWTTSGAGTITTSPCTLSGTGGSATCSVTYAPTAVGTGSHLMTAYYSGDVTFTASSGAQTVTVNKKTASVTPNTGTKVYGATDPTLTGTLANFQAGDNVTATYSRTAGETVTGSPYTISATLSPAGVLGNYTITYNTAAFTITKKAASVSPSAASKTYGDVDPTLSGTLTGFVSGDSVTAAYSRTAGEAAGGTYTISASLSPTIVLANYTITYNTAAFTINKKTASVTPNAATKVYGAVDPALTGTLTGFLAGDNVTATYSRAAGETVAGSPYTISATLSPAGVLGNYTITNNTAAFTITKKDASVVANAASKTYGAADPALTGTLTGFLAGDGVTATYSRTTGETLAGSPYAISATLSPVGVLGNYNITNTPAAFTINPKVASVTPNAASKGFGDPDPALTGTLSGFLAGDNVTATYSRTAGETVAGSPYTISATLAPTGVLGNYNVTYNTADLTITAAQANKTLTIDKVGSGTVTKDPDQLHYANGDVVTLTATPADGWTFSGWSANVVAGKVTISGNMTVTATFTQNEYNLNITINGNGTVTKAPEKPTYHYGDVVTLTAVPDAGWVLESWSANVVSGKVTITDNTTVTATFIVSVNQAPSFTSTAVTAANEGALYTYAITATDPNVGDTLTISATTKPTWLTFTDNGNGTATLTGTPTHAEVGSHDVVLHVSDSSLSADQPFTIVVAHVNHAPAFTSTPVALADEDIVYTYNVTASDPDTGDTLTISAPTKPAWLTLTDNGSGTATLTGTPTAANVGINNVTLRVNDGTADVDQTFTIDVGHTNHGPSFTSTAVTTVNQGALYTYAITATDPDEGDMLTITAPTRPAWLTLTDNHDRTATLTGTPTNSDVGDHAVMLQVSDGTTVASQPFTVTVVNVNDAPVLAQPADQNNPKGATVSLQLSASDIDPGTTLTYTATGLPAGLSIDPASGLISGTLTADANTYPVTATVNDGSGAANNTDSKTFNWVVVEPTYTLTVNKAGSGSVTKDPSQATYHNGDVVTLTAAPADGWSFGSWSANVVDGKVTISGDTTVTATFTQNAPTYTLTITKVGNGTVTKAPDQATYNNGDQVTLTATPDAGWSFGSWSANVVDGKVTIAGDTTVTATFTQNAASLLPGIADDADPLWSFTGSWATYNGSGPYSNTLHYSGTVGDSAQIVISGGQQFKLTYVEANSRGVLDVYIDELKVASIDAYSSNFSWQKTWTSGMLTNGLHTVRIVHASGAYIDIDAIELRATLPTSLQPGTADDMDILWNYSGDWTSYYGEGMASNTLHYSTTIGDSAQIAISGGQQIKLTYGAAISRGVTDVYIDEVKVASIDQYSSTFSWQRTWTSNVLTTGSHTVRLVHASGAVTDIDAIQLLATSTSLATGIADDVDSLWSFSGDWTTYNGSGPYSNTLHYSYKTGDYAEILVRGSKQFKLTYVTGNNRGIIDVYVDGAKVASINAYAPIFALQKTWSSDILSSGLHTIRFVHASGTVVDIDAIEVIGEFTTPTVLPGTTADDVDPLWSYSGDWSIYAGGGPYSDSLHYSNTIGDSAQIKISGGKQIKITYLTASNRGVTDVYVDDVKIGSINANSPIFSLMKTWVSGEITPGLHTIRLVHASGTITDIDALDVLADYTTPSVIQGTIADDVDSRWSFNGDWTIYSGGGPYADSLHYSTTIGDSAQIMIEGGHQFKLTYLEASNRGVIDVYIDDVKVDSINANSSTFTLQKIWTSGTFTTGLHTVRLVHADGLIIDVDAIEVLP